ncbi:MAG: hypothetical protein GYA55_07250 [SAR324 cluster bacterium]|uniref:Uncharacterized protein n=1 Tax=SAR324 cluster bacterium TaxID=2024889 RepID=A0A7X9IJS5_9DELT|nr:hypothetical protein [SAR324 cluster bacterium]
MTAEDKGLNLDSYHMLQGFMLVLNHKLRSPLSIIQNDLSFLETTLNNNECKRSLDKCSLISSILKEACPSSVDSKSISQIDLKTFLKSIFNAHPFISVKDKDNFPCFVSTYTELLKLAFLQLASVLKRIMPENIPCIFEIERVDNHEPLVKLSIKAPLRSESEIEASFASSLTDFFCIKAGCDFIEIPLCDCIFWANGFKEELNLKKDAELGIEIILSRYL